MKFIPTVCLALQEWWFNFFGETSVVQWLGLFLAFLFAAGVGFAIYLSTLKGHLAANRSPAALRAFCFVLGTAIAFAAFTLIFYGAFVYYVSGALLLISIIVAVVFFRNSRKLVTK